MANNKVKVREGTKKMKRSLKEIVSESSIHGFSKIFRPTPIALNLLWTVAVIASFIFSSILISNTFKNYFEYKTVTSQSVIQSPSSYDFPSVVFCPLDAFTKVEPLISHIDLTSTSDQSSQQDDGVLTLQVHNNLQLRFLYNMLAGTFNETLRKMLFNPLNETILSCIYDFSFCSFKDFTPFIDNSYGPCLRYTPAKPTTKAGRLNGLKIEILLDPPYKGNILTDRGLNIVIKNSRDYVTHVDGFMIKAGQRTGIKISKTVYEDMPAPFSKCVLSSNGEHSSEIYQYIVKSTNYTYSQDFCHELCVQKYAINECKCHSALILQNFGSDTPCTTMADINCFSSMYNQVLKNLSSYCEDLCPLECTSTSYDVSTSACDYISDNYLQALMQTSLIKDKYPNINKSELASMLVSFEVFLPSLKYTVIAQKPEYIFIDLISSLGGSMGLFFGASLLSLLEQAELLINLIVHCMA